MKKLIKFGIVIMIIPILIGCNKVSKVKEMQLKSVEFTKEEKNIAELIGSSMDYKIYEYKLNEKVKRISINYYKLNEDGNWINNGGMEDSLPLDGRLAISKSKINGQVELSIQGEGGISRITTNPEEVENKEYTAESIVWEEASDIVLEKEIPLMIQVRTNSKVMEGLNLESFNNTNSLKSYEEVFAVSITFSEHDIK